MTLEEEQRLNELMEQIVYEEPIVTNMTVTTIAKTPDGIVVGLGISFTTNPELFVEEAFKIESKERAEADARVKMARLEEYHQTQLNNMALNPAVELNFKGNNVNDGTNAYTVQFLDKKTGSELHSFDIDIKLADKILNI